ncbi:hypothetical protein [Leifsonia shinshuensis]|uniref:PDGLE domain-containing protein n=1 Tax=Leifsonia shinshuensis TaxID=150026 RepID=A0A7G6YEG9_9MICO|nr:hypothetical protein [Leifsonia shinshuensis]QNE36884.1 hypothetical protein F1C12_18360 [Leifsonia shinshuensis]
MTEPGGPPRRRAVVLLLVGGVAAVIGGVVAMLLAKASLDAAARAANRMETLPVGVYAQYTQHAVTADPTGILAGLAVFALGVALLLAGVVVSTRRPRVA